MCAPSAAGRSVRAAILAGVILLSACGDETGDDVEHNGTVGGSQSGDQEPRADEESPGNDVESDAGHDPGDDAGNDSGNEDTGNEDTGHEPGIGEAGRDDGSGAGRGENAPGAEDGSGRGPDGHAGAESRASVDDLPDACPEEVVDAGDSIAAGFTHREVAPSSNELAMLTCDWSAVDDSVASVEVNYSVELIGTDLSELDAADEVSVADADGYLLRADESQVSMFQFDIDGVYVTGGAIDMEDVDDEDMLDLAGAAVEALE
ncbi:hypothetical protein [Phytoactinopolyspora halophila]|nr:hypothetical protein [Phytoactinopolyspora halophila]